FKSKGDSGLDDDPTCQNNPSANPDCDQGDGQGYWNDTRNGAASYLVNTVLSSDPTGINDADYLILGDLNAYAQEDPIQTIVNAGYTDEILASSGNGAYGFVFDGRWGTLDYVLASATMTDQVVSATDYHINADEPDALDYDESFNPSAWYVVDQYRTSDHDPVIVGLDLADPPGGTPDVNDDGFITPSDVVYVVNRLSTTDLTADVNLDGVVTVADADAVKALIGQAFP
ncbi:MAG: dockerin type I domain-containing protein, partial [Chloroflexota bacterium]